MLKRSTCLIMVMSCLSLLVACDSQTTIEYSLDEFQSEVSVTVNDEEIKVSLVYICATDISLTFIEPEQLTDLTVSIVEGEKIISLGEVTINLSDVQNLTSSANIICALYEALGNFGATTHVLNQGEKNNCKGESIYGDYIVTIDTDTLKITSLSIGEYLYLFS